jgi:hypothetical protein
MQPHLEKRCKVTIEELPNVDAPFLASPPPNFTARESPNPTSMAGSNGVRVGCLRCYKGLFVEEFPDLLAGKPISNDRASPPDLDAYMCASGPLVDPNHFEAVELLMTLGLTNGDKDRHLKSKMVSSFLGAI